MLKISSILLLILGIPVCFWAQQAPPAPPQDEPIAIIGATIHVGNGQVIPDGVLLFEKGRITAVDTKSRNNEWQKDRYEQIIADGKHVYPGLIAMYSTLGLNEIEALRPTQDYAETGPDNPNARSIIAYNTDSRVIPTVRGNGVLLAQVSPRSGRWPGLSSVVQLDAWNWEDAAYATDEGLHLNWPIPLSSARSAESEESNRSQEYQKQIDALDVFMREAMAYQQGPAPKDRNLRFEALAPLFKGERRLYIYANHGSAIQDAVLWAKEYGITPVIIGGRDSWQITGFLKENNISVVLVDTHKLPGTMDEDIDQPFKTPALLRDAGVAFALTVDGFWQQRNLAFQAGQMVGYGLTKAEALQAITQSPARIMGVEDRAGTLAVGKDAHILLVDGDLLDMRTCKVEQAFIQGRRIDMDNHHKQLYRKYRDKYAKGN